MASLPFFPIFFFTLLIGNAVTPACSVSPKTPAPPPGNVSKVEDAVYFHIYYGQSFKVIKNGGDGKSYLLMQNNSKMAARTKYCTGRIKSFVVPLMNMSVDAANFPLSFLELLGMVQNLKGITSDSITSQCVLKSYSDGNIAIINKTDISQLSQFAANFITSANVDQACNYATFLPLEESAPLQRAEWIKYLGTFMNAEWRANQVFDAVKANYLCLKNSASGRTTSFKPVVAWLQYTDGVWSFTSDAYKTRFVEDSGGENIDYAIRKNSYNISILEDVDDFHAVLCTVDMVIDETYAADPSKYTLSTFLENLGIDDHSWFDFLTNQSLWRYDKRTRSPNSLDWYDGGVSQPHLVLADMLEAFFPTGNYTTTFFRNLAKEEQVISINGDMCERDGSVPMDPTLVPCQNAK